MYVSGPVCESIHVGEWYEVINMGEPLWCMYGL